MLLSSVKKLRLTRQYWPPSPPCCRARRARGGRMRQARGARGRWGSLRSFIFNFAEFLLIQIQETLRQLAPPPKVPLTSIWTKFAIIFKCNIVWNCPYQGWSADEVNTTEDRQLGGQPSVPWVRGKRRGAWTYHGDLSSLSAPECCSHAGFANFQPS